MRQTNQMQQQPLAPLVVQRFSDLVLAAHIADAAVTA
jgi:hypothetical protein